LWQQKKPNSLVEKTKLYIEDFIISVRRFDKKMADILSLEINENHPKKKNKNPVQYSI
jgi:hypothetical protein